MGGGVPTPLASKYLRATAAARSQLLRNPPVPAQPPHRHLAHNNNTNTTQSRTDTEPAPVLPAQCILHVLTTAQSPPCPAAPPPPPPRRVPAQRQQQWTPSPLASRNRHTPADGGRQAGTQAGKSCWADDADRALCSRGGRRAGAQAGRRAGAALLSHRLVGAMTEARATPAAAQQPLCTARTFVMSFWLFGTSPRALASAFLSSKKPAGGRSRQQAGRQACK